MDSPELVEGDRHAAEFGVVKVNLAPGRDLRNDDLEFGNDVVAPVSVVEEDEVDLVDSPDELREEGETVPNVEANAVRQPGCLDVRARFADCPSSSSTVSRMLVPPRSSSACAITMVEAP